MRVLLALPPDIHNLEIYKVAGMNAPPLGLAYIASLLEKAGHKVRIIDSPTLKMTAKEFLHEVKSWKPDMIGLSLMTPTAPKGYRIIKEIKRELGEIPIIVGGSHPTFMYKEALNEGADIVVRFEGEYTTLELANVIEKYGINYSMLKNIKGIAYKTSDNELVVTENRAPISNLDELPWPARHLLPMDKYTVFNKPIKVAHVMASRGCPYGCVYCTTSYFWGRLVRFRSAKKVVDEIEYVVEKYGTKSIVFADDELTLNRRFVEEFIKEIRERGLDITFACGSRVDHVDKKLIKKLYDNGCVMLYFGVESASQSTLNKIGKRITLEQAIKAFKWVKEVKGAASGSFILGFPWETIEDMKKTVEFAIKLDPDYAQFTVLTPYPGTPLYRFAERFGLIVDRNWEHYTTIKPVMRGFRFTLTDLGKMLKYAYRRFYLRFKFIWREFRAGRLKDIASILMREASEVLAEAFKRVI